MASRGTAWRRTAVSSTGRAGLFPCPDLSTFGEASARPIGARTIVSCMDPTPVGMPIPILRRSALRAGYSDNEIRRLRRNGTWTSIRRGGYLQMDGGRSMDGRLRHELLIRSTVPGLRLPAVVSHTSAAVLLGIPLWSTHLGIVHVTRPRPAAGGRSGSLLCHTAAISESEVMAHGDLEITTPARTITDLARTLPFEQAVVAADGALHQGLLTPDDLTAAANAVAGAPGSRAAQRVARFANGLSESVGESRSRVMMHRAGLPAPELQVEVTAADGRALGRSDFGWHRGQLLGEFDGRLKYGRLLKPGETPGDAVFDEKAREDALRDGGSRVVRWTWAELAEPTIVVERIRRAIASIRTEIHVD
jgi:hypothetical protein